MSKFDAEAIAQMASMVHEMLTDAAFTGVKIEPARFSEGALKAFGDEFDGEDVDPSSDEFAREMGYHRITTDQGSFGIWFEPYVSLDLSGTGLDITSFYPAESASEIPKEWCFIGLDEGVPEKLFIELTKLRRQP